MVPVLIKPGAAAAFCRLEEERQSKSPEEHDTERGGFEAELGGRGERSGHTKGPASVKGSEGGRPRCHRQLGMPSAASPC